MNKIKLFCNKALVIMTLLGLLGGLQVNQVYAASTNYNFPITKEIANIPLDNINSISINTKDCRLLIEENTSNLFNFGFFGDADETSFTPTYSVNDSKLTINVTSTSEYVQDLINPKGIVVKVPPIAYEKLEVIADTASIALDLQKIGGNIYVNLQDAKGDFYSESTIDCNLNIDSRDSKILLTSKSYTTGILNVYNKDSKADLSIKELLADVNITNEFGKIELILQTIPININLAIKNTGKLVLPVGWSSSCKLGTGKPNVQVTNKDKFTLTMNGLLPND